ncbi:MAG: (2Fe-2S)-binding protein [Pseudomonadales bacterium]
MIEFTLNGEQVSAELPNDVPLLWAVRDHFKLKGSKFGCGMGLCGACTMHIDGQAQRTCILPIAQVQGKSVTTIEGLAPKDQLHQVQQAWLDHNVPQCGYCQSGQIMSASALLAANPQPTNEQIDSAMSGNICRCGTYPRIRQAIRQASDQLVATSAQTPHEMASEAAASDQHE